MCFSKFAAVLAAATCFVVSHSTTLAQPASPSLVQTVQPSFRIEPIVHRFSGRRGEVIPFEFEIASLGKNMNLKVAPVNLRQEESGVILHDQVAKASDNVKLLTADEFTLGPGEAKTIRGEVTIPITKTNYISFGLLVQDRGQDPNFDEVEGENVATKAGIRFVTQYVLRVDIDTGNASPKEFGQLRLEKGQILSEQGLPLVRAYLDNPTDLAFECFVRATIESEASGKPRPFFLGMPSRSSLQDDGRYLVRIMPRSRLRLEAPVDTPIFAGPQTLKVGITNGRRELVGADFAMDLSPLLFPALAAQIAYVGDGIAVSPSQIEVGTAHGANRMLGMKFFNNSANDQSVLLGVKNLSDQPIEGVKLSPAKFKIRAGKSKNVRVKVQSVSQADHDGLGEITVIAQQVDGQRSQQSLPLLVRRVEREMPNLKVSGIELVELEGRPAFQVSIKNEGTSFVPVSANLEVANARGTSVHITAGYGRWLHPGSEKELVFSSKGELPSGEYILSLAVKTYEDVPATTRTFNIQLNAQPTKTTQAAGPNIRR